LFSDNVMPGAINGLALAEICRERLPEIPVLLTSGFSDAAQAADGRFDILRKPFELSTLQRDRSGDRQCACERPAARPRALNAAC
jgi:DNA-binding NtrC family response regulator